MAGWLAGWLVGWVGLVRVVGPRMDDKIYIYIYK